MSTTTVKPKRVGRRRFLRIALLGTMGALAAEVYLTRDQLRLVPWMVRGRWLASFGESAPVAIVRCPSYADAPAAVRAAWELADGPAVRGKRVVLKPNLIDHLPDRPIHTAPEFLGAAVEYLVANGAAEVVVADGPGFSRDSEHLLETSGLGETLRRLGVPFVDLNYDDLDDVELARNYSGNRGRYERLLLPRTITRADLVVSVPKMKTHHWTGVSLSMKNLFGVVPGVKYGWPKNVLHWNGITPSILALLATVRPGFALVDGVVGLEGDGPIYGTAKPTGVLLAGTDLVSVDATAARVMGIDPSKVEHLRVAGALGFGRIAADRIVVRGEAVEAVAQAFLRPPPNPVSQE